MANVLAGNTGPPPFGQIVTLGFEPQRGINMLSAAVPIPTFNPNFSRHSKCVWRALGLNTFLDQSFELSQSFDAPVNSTKAFRQRAETSLFSAASKSASRRILA